MDFGSKYVYNYSDSEDECVSDEEFEEGMTRADTDEGKVENRLPVKTTAAKIRRQSDDSDDNIDIVCAAAKPDLMVSKAPAGTDFGSTCEADSVPIRPISSSPAPPPPNIQTKQKSGLFSRLFGSSSSSGNKTGEAASIAGVETKKRKKHHWLSSDANFLRKSNLDEQYISNGRRWRRADTNVINVKFDTLKAPSDMHTGDPFHCINCEAVLSKLSKLQESETDSRSWKCEFCDTVNLVDLVDEEIPSAEDTTFMLTPAPCTTASGRSGEDETLVIFCVDTSGSMCVTTEVPGTINMRGSHLDRIQSLNESGESQYLPRQKKNVTYVSRLQGVQAAVDHQLGEMQKEHKNRRVALITFNNEVTVVGDGCGEPVHISGDKLKDKDELIKVGSELGIPKQVKDTRESLGNKVFNLEEGGQTALGPALLISASMACQVPGAKVIICTDGMANVGLGNLDTKNDDAAYSQSSLFYDEVASLAAEKGVSISVISIKGTDCKMVELGKVAEATGGQVNIVDQLKLTQEFGSILADPIIATNVTATLQLHKGLYFRFEESELSKITRYVGNVTKQTEVTFEYGIRKEFKRKQKDKGKKRVSTVKEEMAEERVYDNAVGKSAGNPEEPSDKGATPAPNTSTKETFDQMKELPFQLQIKYTDLDGAQAMRVISQVMPLTNDRHKAERAMNMAAIGSHAAKQSAALALQGDYTTSRLNAFMYQRLLHRKATTSRDLPDQRVYDNFYENALPMENRMNQMQQRERTTHGSTWSDEEMDDCDIECVSDAGAGAGAGKKKPVKKPSLASRYSRAPPSVATVNKSVKSVSRRQECDDDSANIFYSNMAISSKKLQN